MKTKKLSKPQMIAQGTAHMTMNTEAAGVSLELSGKFAVKINWGEILRWLNWMMQF